MSRIERTFDELRQAGYKAFIPFLVIGDPDTPTFMEIVMKIEPRADIIELGIPYTDPVADGPIIQAADTRAFKAGMNFSKACALIREIRSRTKKPIVILTYANVIGVGGRMDRTLDDLSKAGVDGIIIADMPVEESHLFHNSIRDRGMHLVYLVAPTTTPSRMERIAKYANGFLYVVAVKGVTGAREAILEETAETIRLVARVLGDDRKIPICVGFGISKPEHVQELVHLGVDGVIVGSAIIRIIEENQEDKDVMIDRISTLINDLSEKTRK